MAIMEYKPVNTITVPSPIEPKRALTAREDSRDFPSDSLITHVSGSALTVDYYSQVLGEDDQVNAFDPGKAATQQQYIKYKDLVIRQQGGISDDQSEEDKIFTIRGEAIIHSSLIPNEGDVFIAGVGDGRLAMFSITRSQRLSMYRATVHSVEYTLSAYLEANPTWLALLEEKVIQTWHYQADRLLYKESPFITTEEHAFQRRVTDYCCTLQEMYFNWFYNREYSSVLVPEQSAPTLDYFIHRQLRVIFDSEKTDLAKLQAINIEDDALNSRLDLFSFLVSRSKSKLRYIQKEALLISTRGFTYEGYTTNIRHTGIRRLVYPIETRGFVNGTASISYERTERKIQTGEVSHVEIEGVEGKAIYTKLVPLIYPITVDSYYCLSEHFYKADNRQSLLECMVNDYLEGKDSDTKRLELLMDNLQYWPDLERFYYVPVLTILLQSLIRK